MGPFYAVSEKTCREHENTTLVHRDVTLFPQTPTFGHNSFYCFIFPPLYMTKKVERSLWFEDKRQDEQRE